MLAITAAAVLWGTTGVVVQALHRATGLPALTIGFYRLAVAALVLAAVVLRSWRTVTAALRDRPVSLVGVGVGLAAYQALYFVAVTLAGVTVATVVSLGVAPVVTAIWESVSSRARPPLGRVLVIIAAVTGLVLVALGQHGGASGSHPVAGTIAAVGSGLIYGGSAVVSQRLSQRIPAMTLTAVMCGVGALAMVPVAAAAGLGFRPGTTAAGWSVGGLVYLGALTTALAYVLFNAGLRPVDSNRAAVLTLAEPLTAAVLAVLLLDEPLTGLIIAGGVLLLSAVAALHASALFWPTPRSP